MAFRHEKTPPANDAGGVSTKWSNEFGLLTYISVSCRSQNYFLTSNSASIASSSSAPLVEGASPPGASCIGWLT